VTVTQGGAPEVPTQDPDGVLAPWIDNSHVRRSACALWTMIYLGAMFLPVLYVMEILFEGAPIMGIAVIGIYYFYSFVVACRGCCLCCTTDGKTNNCCCCPRATYNQRFFLHTFIHLIMLSVLFGWTKKLRGYPGISFDPVYGSYSDEKWTDLDADGASICDLFEIPVIVFISAGWFCFGLQVLFIILTRLCWYKKSHTEVNTSIGQRSETWMSPFTTFPYIHYVAIVAWSFIVIGLFMCVGVTANAFLGIFGLCSFWARWDPTTAAIVQFILFIISITGAGIAGGRQLLNRILGEKGTVISCDPYDSFLFGPIEPVILCVIITIVHAVANSASLQPFLALPIETTYYYNYVDTSLFPPRLKYMTDIVGQSEQLRDASLAFLILSWIATAGLTVCNVLSYVLKPTDKAKDSPDPAPAEQTQEIPSNFGPPAAQECLQTGPQEGKVSSLQEGAPPSVVPVEVRDVSLSGGGQTRQSDNIAHLSGADLPLDSEEHQSGSDV
jgi:hypothetical protein